MQKSLTAIDLKCPSFKKLNKITIEEQVALYSLAKEHPNTSSNKLIREAEEKQAEGKRGQEKGVKSPFDLCCEICTLSGHDSIAK